MAVLQSYNNADIRAQLERAVITCSGFLAEDHLLGYRCCLINCKSCMTHELMTFFTAEPAYDLISH